MLSQILETPFPHASERAKGNAFARFAMGLAWIAGGTLAWILLKDRVSAWNVYDDPTIASLLVVPSMLFEAARTHRIAKVVNAMWMSFGVTLVILGGFIAFDVSQNGLSNLTQLWPSIGVLIVLIPIEILCVRVVLQPFARQS